MDDVWRCKSSTNHCTKTHAAQKVAENAVPAESRLHRQWFWGLPSTPIGEAKSVEILRKALILRPRDARMYVLHRKSNDSEAPSGPGQLLRQTRGALFSTPHGRRKTSKFQRKSKDSDARCGCGMKEEEDAEHII